MGVQWIQLPQVMLFFVLETSWKGWKIMIPNPRIPQLVVNVSWLPSTCVMVMQLQRQYDSHNCKAHGFEAIITVNQTVVSWGPLVSHFTTIGGIRLTYCYLWMQQLLLHQQWSSMIRVNMQTSTLTHRISFRFKALDWSGPISLQLHRVGLLIKELIFQNLNIVLINIILRNPLLYYK